MRKLKPLVFVPLNPGSPSSPRIAKCVFGTYSVCRDEWALNSKEHAPLTFGRCEGFEANEAASQVDYARRVDELFEPLPANVNSAAHDLLDWVTDCNATGMYANTKSQAEIVCNYLLSAMGAE